LTVTSLNALTSLIAVAAQPAAQFVDQEAGLAGFSRTSQAHLVRHRPGRRRDHLDLQRDSGRLYGQTSTLFAMLRDGMIPELFHKMNPADSHPVPSTVIVAVLISLLPA
jgi:basic amino acid/polyamine antiporter, APA family